MRRLIRFSCAGEELSGTIDEGEGSTGLLCVTGGSQIRTGPHRMLHQISLAMSTAGYPVMRYDRRGVGDSDGSDPGYLESGPDLKAAATAFRMEAPHIKTIIGFGLCDGATTLALHGSGAQIDGIILANPWLVETDPGNLAPAAARAHYRDRLLSPAAWRTILTGGVDILGAIRSIFAAVAKPGDRSLADSVAESLKPYAGKLSLILSRGDGTAIAARSCWDASAFAHVRGEKILTIDTDAHTFARAGDLETLCGAVLAFLRDQSC